MVNELIISHKSIRIELVKPQFVRMSFSGNEEYSIEDMDLIIKVTITYLNFKRFVCLTDFTQYYGTFSLNVQTYLANHPDLIYKYREAFVINKLGLRIQANYFFKLNSKVRVRIFSNEAKARKWLLKKEKKLKAL